MVVVSPQVDPLAKAVSALNGWSISTAPNITLLKCNVSNEQIKW